MSGERIRRSGAWWAGRLTARWGIPLALVVLAAICYVVGYRKGTVLLVILGILLEVFFWRRVMRDEITDHRR